MSTDNKIGSYSYTVEPFHVDFTGHLSMGALGNHMLNVAGFHADERGFGMSRLNAEHHTWVLSRLAIEVIRMPRDGEAFTMQTWVESVHRFFTARNFAVVDKDDVPAIYARSVWAMIDTETRKPLDLLEEHDGQITDYVCNKPCPIESVGRVRMQDPEVVATFRVKYSDIDINGHLNSIRYIEHLLDAFSLDTYRKMRVNRFEISYMAESYYGDELTLYRSDTGNGVYELELKRANGEAFCRSKVFFKGIESN